jgi:DNA-binding IscR family transcriptional regulator
MKYSSKLSDAVHLLSYIEIYHDGDLSSKAIAASIKSNPSVVRQLMSDLRAAGLITTQKGKATARLAKDADKISLYDIYQALKIDHHLLHIDPDTEPKCIVGGNIQAILKAKYQEVEAAAFKEMQTISLKSIIGDILARNEQK